MNRNRMFQSGLLFLALINCSDALAEKVSLGPVGQLHFSITIVNKSCEFEKCNCPTGPKDTFSANASEQLIRARNKSPL